MDEIFYLKELVEKHKENAFSDDVELEAIKVLALLKIAERLSVQNRCLDEVSEKLEAISYEIDRGL